MSPAATTSPTTARAASSRRQVDAGRYGQDDRELHPHRSHGLPDFGVPYYPSTGNCGGRSPTSASRDRTFYGFVNRDFQKVKQDIGTINAEVQDHRRTSP